MDIAMNNEKSWTFLEDLHCCADLRNTISCEMSYTMIISEKKQAAYRIAKALDDQAKPKEVTDMGITYFKAENLHQQILVIPSIGHLYNITSERKGRFYYPVFNVLWKPTSELKRGAKRLANWINLFSA